jgi:putative RNA 2'-phosphotransferase
MNEKEKRRLSKSLSKTLRHQPERIGVELDDAGWCSVDDLLSAYAAKGTQISRQALNEVVATNDKQRFSFSEDGNRIRANQGHSVDVDLGYETAEPPEILLHGTPRQFVEAIRREGLNKMKRHHVHLHRDIATATAVGQRRGKPVLLTIRAGDMHSAGHAFLVTPNDVWLTDHVPTEFIEIPDQ